MQDYAYSYVLSQIETDFVIAGKTVERCRLALTNDIIG